MNRIAILIAVEITALTLWSALYLFRCIAYKRYCKKGGGLKFRYFETSIDDIYSFIGFSQLVIFSLGLIIGIAFGAYQLVKQFI